MQSKAGFCRDSCDFTFKGTSSRTNRRSPVSSHACDNMVDGEKLWQSYGVVGGCSVLAAFARNKTWRRFWIPSREPTYPTWGKGKSSSKVPSRGDMLVPTRVCFKWLQIIHTSILFPGTVFWGKPLYAFLRWFEIPAFTYKWNIQALVFVVLSTLLGTITYPLPAGTDTRRWVSFSEGDMFFRSPETLDF